MSYSPNGLRKLCDEFHLDFSTLKIEENKKYRNTVISGPCQEVGCNNLFSLNFRTFKRGAKCSVHLPNFDVDFLQYYCTKNKIELVDTYKHTNAKTLIKGQCVTVGCLEIFEKSFDILVETSSPCCTFCTKKITNERRNQTNLEKYGTKIATQNLKVKEKTRLTNLERYGVEYGVQDSEIKEKIKKTNLERRGVAYSLQDPKIREQIKQTNIKKFGTEYASQNLEIQKKIKQTTLEKYGVENIAQSFEIKEKVKETNLTKYGVEHAAQNPEIHSKRLSSSYSKKEFTLPSGTKIFLQGYEPYALEILLKKYAEEEIITKAEKMPELWWTDATEQKHRHFIDFYIPKTNTMIEVKSDYTLTRGLEASLRKQDTALKENYSYEIWIINRKKKRTAIIYQTIPSIIIKWFEKNSKLKEAIEKGAELLKIE